MQPTVFLVTSAHRGWHSLRPALEDSPDVNVVGATQDASQAAACAALLRPAALLVDADKSCHRLVPLIRDLHTASPTSRVLLVGDDAAVKERTAQ